MNKEVIAVDMDDVVVETAQSIIDHVNRSYGASVDISNFYSRDPSVWNSPDLQTAVNRVNEYLETDEYFVQEPVQEAIHALRSIQKVHKLYIVTGRPDFTELATRRWLENHLPDLFEDVIFTNYFDKNKVRTKGDVCTALGATVLIDDHIDHCISAQEQGIKPILFGSYPWNTEELIPEGVRLARVKHWPEVENLLVSNGQE
jgi:5'(3')-deoxyribonucleotidase